VQFTRRQAGLDGKKWKKVKKSEKIATATAATQSQLWPEAPCIVYACLPQCCQLLTEISGRSGTKFGAGGKSGSVKLNETIELQDSVHNSVKKHSVFVSSLSIEKKK
jgi:hypothetical protein